MSSISSGSKATVHNYSNPDGALCEFSGSYPSNWTYRINNNPISQEVLVFEPIQRKRGDLETKLIIQ